jgi:tight adherence protein C
VSPLVLVALAAASGAILVVAAWLMLRVSDRDVQLAARVSAARGRWIKPEAVELPRKRALLEPVQSSIAAVGRAVMQSGLLPGRTRAELQQTLASSGFRGPNALAMFIGAKLVLVPAVPLAALALADALGTSSRTRMIMLAAGFIAGLLAPDKIVRSIRDRYLNRLEAGLPDALDLLVICAQAGLSLEPAMARVAAEMRMARPEVADELELTVRELEIMASAPAALANLAKRTGLPTLQRLVSTLVQTMQYGTPLTDALRTLSAEVRQQALTRFEARAARLPVLLTMPMIMFILPCVFMIVGGPAVIQVMRSLGH